MKRAFLAGFLVFALSTVAEAGLIDRGGGLIYDSDLDITWLQDANYAGVAMSHDEALAWAESLVYQGYEDWRLPSALNQDGTGPDSTYSFIPGSTSPPKVCDDSEMGHLYFISLGNPLDPNDEFPTNSGPFVNVQQHYWYAESGIDTGDSGAGCRVARRHRRRNRHVVAQTRESVINKAAAC